ncbi:DUF4239 domain-containing protein [Halomonas sp. ML-15]|uniref:bestrophin-like domain n=1 Tax=Halomonas sp. ML-15 TaxID=2773305 RepID=UPI001745C9BA|nr:DUF4239 domain-containing protein [Halomonas sp. ML-15]MBD3895024.1 DUF4239 domain-containing protein [Halomonas sp. ML-15]
MIRFWFEFHPLVILPLLLALFLASGALIHWLQFHSPFSTRLKGAALGLPTFVAISTLFALFAAFLLADTMDRKGRASQAVQTESAALFGLGVASETTMASEGRIRAALLDYADSVVKDEWPRLLQESGSSRTEQALLELLRAVRDAANDEGHSAATHGQMLSLAQDIVDARTDRIAVVANHYQKFSWSALFLLGFLTQFVMGMGFLDRASANRHAIVIFSLAAVVALWLIAIQDNPFRGAVQVSPEAIEQAVSTWRN